MALRNAFENLSTEATNDLVLTLLTMILEKMPRVDANDRLMVSHAESNPTVALSSGQTLSNVSNVANMTQIGGRDTAHVPQALANMGTQHIYNNIEVS